MQATCDSGQSLQKVKSVLEPSNAHGVSGILRCVRTGRIVPQEVPDVVSAAAGSDEGKEQIAGSSCRCITSLLRSWSGGHRPVLHDWPDGRCRIILGHTRDAMKRGYASHPHPYPRITVEEPEPT